MVPWGGTTAPPQPIPTQGYINSLASGRGPPLDRKHYGRLKVSASAQKLSPRDWYWCIGMRSRRPLLRWSSLLTLYVRIWAVTLTVVSTVLALLAVPVASATAPTSTTLLSESLSLSGGNRTQPIQFSPVTLPKGAQFEGATLQVSAPSDPSLGPSDIGIEGPSNQTIWGWNGGFGWAGSSNQVGVEANNGSGSGNLLVPSGARVDSAEAAIRTVTTPLTGNYTVRAGIGGSQVFYRSGSQPYSAATPLLWIASNSSITAVATGMESNGTPILAVGDAQGILSLYLLTDGQPGSPGRLIYNAVLDAPNPVEGVIIAELPGAEGLSAVAVSGTYAYVSEENHLGQWGTNILELPSDATGGSPSITSMALLRYETGNPAIVAGCLDRAIFVWNWSTSPTSYGFQTIAQRLFQFSWIPTALGASSTTGSPAIISVAGQGAGAVLSASSTRVSTVGNLSVPNGVTVRSLIVNSTGETILAGGEDGSIYPFTAPGWIAQTPIPLGVDPVESLAADPFTSGNAAIAVTGGNALELVSQQASGGAWSVQQLESVTSADVAGPIAVGPLFGASEPDIVVGVGSEVFASISQATFQRVGLPSLADNITQAMTAAPKMMDSYSDRWDNVSLYLDSAGGATALWGPFVTYSLSLNLSITRLVGPMIGASGVPSKTVTLQFYSGTAGVLDVAVSEMVQEPPLVGSLQWFENYLRVDGIVPAVGLLITGVFLAVVGSYSYRRHSRKRQSPASESGAASGAPSRAKGKVARSDPQPIHGGG